MIGVKEGRASAMEQQIRGILRGEKDITNDEQGIEIDANSEDKLE